MPFLGVFESCLFQRSIENQNVGIQKDIDSRAEWEGESWRMKRVSCIIGSEGGM